MNVYISSHDRVLAEDAAKVLREAGHTITSTWHASEAICFNPIPDDEQATRAEDNAFKIRGSSALVLISGNDRYPGGKFVEAGMALAWNIPVFIAGKRENLLLHQHSTRLAATIEGVVTHLAEFEQFDI